MQRNKLPIDQIKSRYSSNVLYINVLNYRYITNSYTWFFEATCSKCTLVSSF